MSATNTAHMGEPGEVNGGEDAEAGAGGSSNRGQRVCCATNGG